MMKPLKDAYPDMNIVAVDYDPGATRVDQENRMKLMARRIRESRVIHDQMSNSIFHALSF